MYLPNYMFCAMELILIDLAMRSYGHVSQGTAIKRYNIVIYYSELLGISG